MGVREKVHYAMRPPKPTFQSFLLADLVFRQDTGKGCAIGIFDCIWAPIFPAVHHTLGILIALSDGEGDYVVRVDFANGQDQVISSSEELQVSAGSRLDTFRIGIQTYGLILPAPGRYFFKLYCNGDFVHDLPLVVRQIDVKENAQ